MSCNLESGRTTFVAARGMLSILFGLCMVFGLVLGLNLILLFAVYTLLEGILTILASFRINRSYFRRRPLVLEGCFNLVVAAVTFALQPLWSIALPLLVATWAVFTGLLMVVVSARLRARITEGWAPILVGAIRMSYGTILWFLPSNIPNFGNMSGYAVFFAVVTGLGAALSGAAMIASGTRTAPLVKSPHG